LTKSPPSRRLTPLVLPTVLILAAVLSACGGDGDGDVQPNPVTAVTVTAPTTEISAGHTVQLTATAHDANGTALEGKSFEWTSGIGSVASVSPAGLVTGLAKGQSEIRATTEGVTGSIVITVQLAPLPDPASVGLQPIASGLRFPTYLTSPPGDARLFVLEKAGNIRVIKGGILLPTPFLDLTDQVNSTGGETGLLGLAFFPDYASSGRLIVHYTNLEVDTRVSRFRVSAVPDQADLASESVVLAVEQPGVAHKGGQVLFGPDGLLYIGLGDGDDNDGGRGQSLRELFASILRIDVSSGATYNVPPDNPFVATPDARPEVWSYGLRNPWRFSFDPVTGDLYIGDVGERRWEEVNYASAASGAGKGVNYGWGRMEGGHCFQVNTQCDQTGLTLPVLEYDHLEGCSVIGGYVYRGSAIPGLQGHYFYADYCSGWVRSFRMDGGVAVDRTEWPTLQPGGPVTSFGEDAAGELYLLTEEGGVFKIVPQ
jgi:glucose/arabinose dehydrogenase